MAKKAQTQSVNPIQQKLDTLVEERTQNLQAMETAKQAFEKAQAKVIEINGAINVLVELFSSQGESDDTESKADTGANTNEG